MDNFKGFNFIMIYELSSPDIQISFLSEQSVYIYLLKCNFLIEAKIV